MNAQELIESGKLELYVAGALCGKEAREVAAMVQADPMLQREVQAIEEAMLATLTEGSIQPRPQLKDKIRAAVEKQSTNNNGSTLRVERTSGKVVAMNTTNTWLAAASVALLLALGITYYLLNRKIDIQQAELAALTEKYTQQLAGNDSSKAEMTKLSAQLALINHSKTRKVILNGVATSPTSNAIVYWNTENGRVIINPSVLPPAPVGKQYQLWALLDGKPIDAGVFDINSDSIKLQEVKHIANAQAFAITLEDKGGVPSPTLSAMYAMGSI